MQKNDRVFIKDNAAQAKAQSQEFPLSEENYVDKAEDVIKNLTKPEILNNGKQRPGKIVRTSKIRNLLAMVSDIYNDVSILNDDKLGSDIVGRISYMKLRFYYEAGREPLVKRLLSESEVFEILDKIGNSKKNYILFSRYMEALVAFRKYYGGNDD